jgi:hypothetical protein
MYEEGDAARLDKGSRFRMESSGEVLDEWSGTATQTERDAVYEAMFAMLDGTLFRSYRIMDDFRCPGELYVLVGDDLALKIRITSFDSFGVVRVVSRDQLSRRFGGRKDP